MTDKATATATTPKAKKASAPRPRNNVSVALSEETRASIAAAAKRFGAFGVTERKLKKLVADEAARRCADLDAAAILHAVLTAEG